MPSIGVVIPCAKHHWTVVHNAYQSCSDNVKIIISCDWIDEFIEPFNRKNLWVLSTSSIVPAGVCYMRNKAITMLDTDLIIPLDADDTFTPDGIQSLVDAWEPGTWVYGDAMQDGRIKKAPPPGMLKQKNLTQATMCFAKSDWLKVGGYDPRYNIGAEDWAFQLALTRANVFPRKIDKIVYNYSVGGQRSNFGDCRNIILELLRLDYGISPP